MSARSLLTSWKVSLEFCAQTSSARFSSARTTPESNPRGCMVRRLKAKNSTSSHNKSKSCMHSPNKQYPLPAHFAAVNLKWLTVTIFHAISQPSCDLTLLASIRKFEAAVPSTAIFANNTARCRISTHTQKKSLQITAPRSPTTEQ
jgi:hypothetical protein